MPEPVVDLTPWAPSQHRGMRCCCRWPGAVECANSRAGLPYQGDDAVAFRDPDVACNCCCHDRDIEDEDDE